MEVLKHCLLSDYVIIMQKSSMKQYEYNKAHKSLSPLERKWSQNNTNYTAPVSLHKLKQTKNNTCKTSNVKILIRKMTSFYVAIKILKTYFLRI